jgi:hypothetical protein
MPRISLRTLRSAKPIWEKVKPKPFDKKDLGRKFMLQPLTIRLNY